MLFLFARLRDWYPHDGDYNHPWCRHHIWLLLQEVSTNVTVRFCIFGPQCFKDEENLSFHLHIRCTGKTLIWQVRHVWLHTREWSLEFRASAVSRIPQQCSLWFHLDVMQPFYCFYLDSHNRMRGEAWQEMKCQQFFMHYYWLHKENRTYRGVLDVTEKPQLLLLCNMQSDIPTVVEEGPLIPTAQDVRTDQFDSQIWLAAPSSLFSILRRWLLMSRRSILCHCLPALSTVTSPSARVVVLCTSSSPAASIG